MTDQNLLPCGLQALQAIGLPRDARICQFARVSDGTVFGMPLFPVNSIGGWKDPVGSVCGRQDQNAPQLRSWNVQPQVRILLNVYQVTDERQFTVAMAFYDAEADHHGDHHITCVRRPAHSDTSQSASDCGSILAICRCDNQPAGVPEFLRGNARRNYPQSLFARVAPMAGTVYSAMDATNFF